MLSYINQQIYLNHTLLTEKKIAMQDVYELLRTDLLKQKAVVNVVNLTQSGCRGFTGITGKFIPQRVSPKPQW